MRALFQRQSFLGQFPPIAGYLANIPPDKNRRNFTKGKPHVIVGHAGWGEKLYADHKLINCFEFFIPHAVEISCKREPDCYVIIVDSNGVSYSHASTDARNHREKIVWEVTIDKSYVYFMSQLAYVDY